MFFRLVVAINDPEFPIHPSLLINADQTSVLLIPGGTDRTYHPKGDKQVPVFGKEEKRAFTVLQGICVDGSVLPTQFVWKGKTDESLPVRDRTNKKSRRYEAEQKGHTFVFREGSYWSSLTTMKQWLKDVVVPYREWQLTVYCLTPEHKMILILDVYVVHISAEMRDWIRVTYPWLILIYVPAGCTSNLQPCDVGLQPLFKHMNKQAANRYFAEQITLTMKKNHNLSALKLSMDIGPLRDACVSWILDSVDYLNSPARLDLNKKAWSNCKFKTWNLSWECLSSREALVAWSNKPEEYCTRILVSRSIHTKKDRAPKDPPAPEDIDITADDDDNIPFSLLESEVDKGLIPAAAQSTVMTDSKQQSLKSSKATKSSQPISKKGPATSTATPKFLNSVLCISASKFSSSTRVGNLSGLYLLGDPVSESQTDQREVLLGLYQFDEDSTG